MAFTDIAPILNGQRRDPNLQLASFTPGPFYQSLEQPESGRRNITEVRRPDDPGTIPATDDNLGRGFYQINNLTWRDYAPRAGVDLKKFPRADLASELVQTKVANIIPLNRWQRSAKVLEKQYGPLDESKTVGELSQAVYRPGEGGDPMLQQAAAGPWQKYQDPSRPGPWSRFGKAPPPPQDRPGIPALPGEPSKPTVPMGPQGGAFGRIGEAFADPWGGPYGVDPKYREFYGVDQPVSAQELLTLRGQVHTLDDVIIQGGAAAWDVLQRAGQSGIQGLAQTVGELAYAMHLTDDPDKVARDLNLAAQERGGRVGETYRISPFREREGGMTGGQYVRQQMPGGFTAPLERFGFATGAQATAEEARRWGSRAAQAFATAQQDIAERQKLERERIGFGATAPTRKAIEELETGPQRRQEERIREHEAQVGRRPEDPALRRRMEQLGIAPDPTRGVPVGGLEVPGRPEASRAIVLRQQQKRDAAVAAGANAQQAQTAVNISEGKVADAQAKVNEATRIMGDPLAEGTSEAVGKRVKAAAQSVFDTVEAERDKQAGFGAALNNAPNIDTSSIIRVIRETLPDLTVEQSKTWASFLRNLLTDKDGLQPRIGGLDDLLKAIQKGDLNQTLNFKRADKLRRALNDVLDKKESAGTSLSVDELHAVKKLKNQLQSVMMSTHTPFKTAMENYRKLSEPVNYIRDNATLDPLIEVGDPRSTNRAMADAEVAKHLFERVNKGDRAVELLIQQDPGLVDATKLHLVADLFGGKPELKEGALAAWLYRNQVGLRQLGLYDSFKTWDAAMKTANEALQKAQGTFEEAQKIATEKGKTAEAAEKIWTESVQKGGQLEKGAYDDMLKRVEEEKKRRTEGEEAGFIQRKRDIYREPRAMTPAERRQQAAEGRQESPEDAKDRLVKQQKEQLKAVENQMKKTEPPERRARKRQEIFETIRNRIDATPPEKMGENIRRLANSGRAANMLTNSEHVALLRRAADIDRRYGNTAAGNARRKALLWVVTAEIARGAGIAASAFLIYRLWEGIIGR